ncbi:unnamed protein product [Alternaria alternata]
MENLQEFTSTFEATVGSYFPAKQPYSQVHVLCVHWEKNDIFPISEIERLRACLEGRYGYKAATLALPNDDTRELRLITEIVDFVKQYSTVEDSLIILYYAGHCGRNKDGLAEWAAFEKGGPTVQWHIVQQLLFAATGDVLLSLDCCFASLIKKGQKSKGRFELIAACGMNAWTPVPGPLSFTSLLISELPEHATEETPVHHDFARTKQTGIKLQHLDDLSQPRFMQKPTGYVIFRASLSDDPKGRELAEWLKTAPPNNVTAIHIEAMVADARRIQNLVGLVQGTQEMFVKGSVFEKLSFPAKQEIVRAFRNLDTTLMTSSRMADDAGLRGNSEAVKGALEGIQSTLNAACAAVETPVLTQLGQGDFQEAYKNEVVASTGTSAAISLCQMYHGIYSSPEKKEISRDLVIVPAKKERIETGTIDGSTVIVETYQYEEDPSTSRPYEETLEQVQKMASILCHPKASTLHVLPCLGFYHKKVEHSFGVAFRAPPYFNPEKKPITLLSLYSKEKRVALSHRICLAAKLAAALDGFHTVGWFHKGFRSENVMFLPMEAPRNNISAEPVDIAPTFVAQQGSIDISNPYLFGFEYMRMQDAGTNLEADDSLERDLYRHPDRWGKPKGIILAEIAFWQPIQKIVEVQETEVLRRSLSGAEVLKRLQSKCNSRLPHQVGHMFHTTVMACLGFKSATVQMDAYETQKYYQENIRTRLEAAVGKV